MSNILVLDVEKFNYLLNTLLFKEKVPNFSKISKKWIQFDIDYAPNDINIVEYQFMTH